MSGRLHITVATTNLQAHMPLHGVARSVRKVRRQAHPQLWGFQEVGGVRKWAVIRAALGRHFGGARLRGEAAATPVAWDRRRFRLERKMSWHLSDPTEVGHAGAGPHRLRGKDAAVVVLWDRHLHRHAVLANAHLAPEPGLNDARETLHRSQVYGLVNLVHWLREHYPTAVLFLVGDDNTATRDRLHPLEEAGLHIGRDVATHGPHALDRIVSTAPHQGMRAIPTDSDHDALIGEF